MTPPITCINIHIIPFTWSNVAYASPSYWFGDTAPDAVPLAKSAFQSQPLSEANQSNSTYTRVT